MFDKAHLSSISVTKYI